MQASEATQLALAGTNPRPSWETPNRGPNDTGLSWTVMIDTDGMAGKGGQEPRIIRDKEKLLYFRILKKHTNQ